jgi:soluble lytic murein transglycosylase
LIHAIIRQESRFHSKAQSSAGAKGLMQLRKATAEEVAKKHKIHIKDLYNIHTNTKLGHAHIKELLHEFDGSLVLVLAAYNAGPNVVKKWIQEIGDPRTGEADVLNWVELIPYKETRNYIQRVLENLIFYRYNFRLPDICLYKLMRQKYHG